ncbi:MAG: (d)CMP kinase [Actinomycetota bacterium]|nr:(d)CMP kinase [Actinomycetota bacterium]
MRVPVIAVDGPAGSGKSSVCRGVAARLGLRYLDTGAMYRAMTWAMLEAGVDPDDPQSVAAHAPGVSVTSGTDPAAPTIHVDGIDVAGPIRGEAVTGAVSAVSAVPAVRDLLVRVQREEVMAATATGAGIVVEGRDITTVVLPDADLKVFITADPGVRALRRAAEDAGRGSAAGDVARTHTSILERDAKDTSRAASPLSLAHDAVLVDTTDMTLDEVIDHVCDLADALPG